MPPAAIWTRSPSRSSFAAQTSGAAILFLTAGGNQVDAAKASALAGEPLGKADAALIRAQTGFAIGGVAPVGHLTPIRAWLDPRLIGLRRGLGRRRHAAPYFRDCPCGSDPSDRRTNRRFLTA